MGTYYLKTPISDDDITKLRVGDTIYVSGILVSARDAAHVRMVESLHKGEKLPVDLRVALFITRDQWPLSRVIPGG